MSISKMSPQMMSRTILIFTLVTGIAPLLAKNKPSTFWSKRAGNQNIPGHIKQDMSTQTFYTPRNTERSNKKLDKYMHFLFSTIIQTLEMERDNHGFPKSESWPIRDRYFCQAQFKIKSNELN